MVFSATALASLRNVGPASNPVDCELDRRVVRGDQLVDRGRRHKRPRCVMGGENVSITANAGESEPCEPVIG